MKLARLNGAMLKSAARGAVNRRGFTMVELLAVLVIMVVLGGAFLSALSITFDSFYQTQDQVEGRRDIETAFQVLGRQFSNIALGMPNSRNTSYPGSFANSFRSTSGPNPIMALMGNNGELWGGPVTLANFGLNGGVVPTGSAAFQNTMVQTPLSSSEPHIYGGTAMYYAWGSPLTSQRGDILRMVASADVGTISVISNNASIGKRDVTMRLLDSGQENLLTDFRVEGNPWTLTEGPGFDIRSWAVFPSIGLPLLITDIKPGGVTEFRFTAPNNDQSAFDMQASLAGYADLHAVQVARLYVNNEHELVQEIFGSDYTDSSKSVINVLATHVAALYFKFDKERHLLSMYIAVSGMDSDPSAAAALVPLTGWPGTAPRVPGDLRVTAQSMSWRIRN